MTDLDATTAGSRTCPACGARNPGGAGRCQRCGTPLEAHVPSDAARGDLELEEAWRAAGAEGHDADVERVDGTLRCPTCSSALDPFAAAVRRWEVRDTPTDRSDLTVVALVCPVCGTLGRAVLSPEDAPGPPPPLEMGPDRVDPRDVRPGEVPWRRPPPTGSDPEHPLGDDRQFFEPARPGRLAEQRSLLDDEGEDIRQYTGEPVETDEGWVLPQQQNVGPGNEAGGGEWPDPASPPAAAPDDDPTAEA